eukprot:Skav206199  [mRNA]  locus=scaffold1844:339458:343814:- [translate_table: standard]
MDQLLPCKRAFEEDDHKFKTIAEAHGVLSDVKKKRVYDTKGMLGLRQFEARNQCEVARTKEHAKTEARRQIAEEKKRGAQQNSERLRRKQEEKRALQKEKAEINAREKRLGAPDSCGDRALLGREIHSANTMASEESVQFSDSVTAVTSPQSPETIPEVGNRSVRDSMGTPYVDASAASDEETFADSARTASIFPAAVEESHLAAPEVHLLGEKPTAEPAIVEIDDDFGAPSPEEVSQVVPMTGWKQLIPTSDPDSSTAIRPVSPLPEAQSPHPDSEVARPRAPVFLHIYDAWPSGGIVDAAAALVCSLGFKFEYPEALLPDEDHPCCAAAKTCELNEATETCTTKCKAKIMNWAESDIWLPESCVSPADATPPESFKAFKVTQEPAIQRLNKVLAHKRMPLKLDTQAAADLDMSSTQ